MTPEKQIELKQNLEKNLNKKLNSIFNKINRENKRSIKIYGMPINSMMFKNELTDKLRSHYKKTVSSFLGVALDQKILSEEYFNNWIEETIEDSSSQIINTTNSNINTVITSLRTEAMDIDGIIDYNRISVASGLILRRRFKKRSELISIAETQTSAEATKEEEANTASKREDRKITKTWITMMDQLVRDSHNPMHGVKVNIDENFKVPLPKTKTNPMGIGTEEMKFPGQRIGVSIGNWIRCRCVALYEFIK